MCAFTVEQLKARIELDPKDVARGRNHLATLVQEVRAKGDGVLALDVGKICEGPGPEGEAAHVVFCKVLDGDRFVRNYTLWYRYRRGAWATAEAEYIFLLAFGTKGAFLDRTGLALADTQGIALDGHFCGRGDGYLGSPDIGAPLKADPKILKLNDRRFVKHENSRGYTL